jgi:hypothetical protein
MRYIKKKLQIATMLLVLSWPVGGMAQGLFQRGVPDEVYYGSAHSQGLMQNRGVSEATGIFANQTFGANHEGAFVNQTFGQNVPLGNELLVLLTASAGYVAWSRKKKKQN